MFNKTVILLVLSAFYIVWLPTSVTAENQEQLSEPLPILQNSHSGAVSSIAFSKTGALMVTGGSDGRIKIWDTRSLKIIRERVFRSAMFDYFISINSVAISPDSILIAAGTAENKVRILDVKSGGNIATLDARLGIVDKEHFDSEVNSVQFSPNGKSLAVAAGETITLWNTSTWDLEKVFETFDFTVMSLSYSHDGKSLATADASGAIKIWRVKDGTLVKQINKHPSWASVVIFSPDGKTISSGSLNENISTNSKRVGGQIIISRTDTGEVVRKLSNGTVSIHSLSYSPDGVILASGNSDGTVVLWNQGKQSDPIVFREPDGSSVESVAFSPSGYLAAGYSDGTIRLWNYEKKRIIHKRTNHSRPVYSVAFSPDGKVFATGDSGYLRLWNSANRKLWKVLKGEGWTVNTIAFHPQGHHLVTGSWDGKMELWDTKKAKRIGIVDAHKAKINSIAFSPDGQTIATSSGDNTVKLWGSQTGELKKTFKDDSEGIKSLVFLPDGKSLILGGRDSAINVLDIASGRLVKQFKGSSNEVDALALSPNKNLLFSATTFGEGITAGDIEIWDFQTGKRIHRIKGYVGSTLTVDVSPDGKRFASGSADQSVKLWNVTTGQLIKKLTGHIGNVYSVQFSSDGELLVSAGEDGAFKIWNGKSGELLETVYALDVKDYLIIKSNGSILGTTAGKNRIVLPH